jgi:hypothetical protein
MKRGREIGKSLIFRGSLSLNGSKICGCNHGEFRAFSSLILSLVASWCTFIEEGVLFRRASTQELHFWVMDSIRPSLGDGGSWMHCGHYSFAHTRPLALQYHKLTFAPPIVSAADHLCHNIG